MKELEMIEQLKQDILENIEQMDQDNMDTQTHLLEKQAAVISHLWEINRLKENESYGGQPETLEEDEESEPSQPSAPPERKSYQFERKLRGGIVPQIDGFVPEGVVRKLGLEHGDMVYAKAINTNDPQRSHFEYEIAEKGDGEDAPYRIQLNFCPVKKEAGRLVVEKSEETGEFIRFNEGPYTIVLSEDDVFKQRINEGDLVDIAYFDGTPTHAKVIWTHKIKEASLSIPETLNHTSKKSEKPEKKPVTIYDQTLKEKTILVIGNEPKKSLYQYSIEQRGGTFLWGDAKEDFTRVEAKVRKADIVVFLLGVSGHTGMEHIKQMCKNHNVIFETTWSNGQSSILRIAEEF
ncbi:DUF2325 domain-containing protein [Lentibacillus sediminis]|uniref:DUF2325 domain-containing protein n=1 Tax=Lentibacillus sediminis TaxID=1940529 RepID=UPI000C1C772D|nr:DUF2325 domain-containing protein [Lentibacillus sediminis]